METVRWVALLATYSLGGCAFNLRPPNVEGDAGGDAAGGVDAPVDAVVNPANPCATPDPTGLVVCFAFDDDLGDGMLTDGSANSLDAVTSGLTAITRPVGAGTSQAASVGAAASTKVPDVALVELGASFTLSAWILPISHPGNEGLTDREGTYAMSVYDNGELRCWHNRAAGLAIQTTGPVVLAAWQFAACTWDGTQLCAIVIPAAGPNILRTCTTLAASGPAIGRHGVSVGSMQNGSGVAESQFNGSIDDFRIYTRALTNIELCGLANRATTCLP